MAQTTILAAGQTAATSASVTIEAGGSATLSIVPAAGESIPINVGFPIKLVGGEAAAEGVLSFVNPTVVVGAPGVWVVERADISAYGVDVAILADQ